MAKFSAILRGTRAECECELPASAGGESQRFGVRPLNGLEEAEALRLARSDATEAGVSDPKPGDPVYDLALMVHTLAIGCVDIDSAKDARAPFFGGGAAEIRRHLSREEIVYLYAQHQAWQDEAAPTALRLTSEEMLVGVATMGGESDEDAARFFLRLRPGMQLSFTRFTARLAWSSLVPKSPPTSSAETNGSAS